MRKKWILFSMATTLLFASISGCTDEITGCVETSYQRNGSIIAFTADFPGNGTMTRGMQLSASNTSSFSVSASYYTSGTYENAACGSYFLNQQGLTAIGSSGQSWPGAEYTVSFFAYAPYSNMVGIESAEALGRPVYTYTVPSDITSQIDFMTAESLDVSGEETTDPVSLAFSHRLADIRFNVYNEGENDMTVHSIGLYGLKYSGTYSSGTQWTLTGERNSAASHPFLLDLGDRTDPYDGVEMAAGSEAADVTATDSHIMVIPQTVPAGTRLIDVDATVNGTRQVFHCILRTDLSFSMGESYNIRLTLGYNHVSISILSIADWILGSDTSGTSPRERGGTAVDSDTMIENWSEQSDDSGTTPRSRDESDHEVTGISDWTEQG